MKQFRQYGESVTKLKNNNFKTIKSKILKQNMKTVILTTILSITILLIFLWFKEPFHNISSYVIATNKHNLLGTIIVNIDYNYNFLVGLLVLASFFVIFNLTYRYFINSIDQELYRYGNDLINFDNIMDNKSDINAEYSMLSREYRQFVDAIDALKNDAKSEERKKDILITSLAHDIRTPLTSLLGYVQIINESPNLDNENRDKFSQLALNKGKILEDLINELFEIVQFNITKLELVKVPIELDILLNQLIEENKWKLLDKNVVLENFIETNISLMADPSKIGRLFSNLFSNAIKFVNTGGKIIINAKNRDDIVVVQITNTGASIDKDKLSRLFDEFYKVDNSRSNDSHSIGIGLSVAKKIVDAHQGKILADSNNSTVSFTVELPRT